MGLVITMSRRYGTGASTIAKELSERLGLPVYDKVNVEQEVRKNAFETEAEAIRELAEKRIEETDAEREKYYYQHTGRTWGDVSDYHIILDTSEWGIENCADVLIRYFERMQYI